MSFYRFFQHILFAFSLLFTLEALSQSSCENAFIKFAKEQLQEEFSSKMPKNWESKVLSSTNRWSKNDLERFLSFLEERIGKEEALKRIKSVSYFRNFNFKSFLERVNLYEKYIGRDGVNDRLKDL